MGSVVELARAQFPAWLHTGGVTLDQDLHLLQAQFLHLEYGVRSSIQHVSLALGVIYSRCLIIVPHYYNLLTVLGLWTPSDCDFRKILVLSEPQFSPSRRWSCAYQPEADFCCLAPLAPDLLTVVLAVMGGLMWGLRRESLTPAPETLKQQRFRHQKGFY